MSFTVLWDNFLGSAYCRPFSFTDFYIAHGLPPDLIPSVPAIPCLEFVKMCGSLSSKTFLRPHMQLCCSIAMSRTPPDRSSPQDERVYKIEKHLTHFQSRKFRYSSSSRSPSVCSRFSARTERAGVYQNGEISAKIWCKLSCQFDNVFLRKDWLAGQDYEVPGRDEGHHGPSNKLFLAGI